ncbi:MAG: CarD family transcriptional regulator [Oscillospiraceae bacterium]
MFTEGQLVIYGGEGVCRIAAVGPSSLSGTDKTKLYYTLTPLTRSGTVLTPVDTKVLMRPILSRQEAEDFIAQLPQLPPEEPESRSMRLLKEFYQQIVTSYDCRRMAGLIRSAVRRRKHALRTGRKVSQMDERYLRRAETLSTVNWPPLWTCRRRRYCPTSAAPAPSGRNDTADPLFHMEKPHPHQAGGASSMRLCVFYRVWPLPRMMYL